MNQYDSILKAYSDSGLRTIEDWSIRGRDILMGSAPRAKASHRGVELALYSRDQTQHHPKKVSAAE
jgi:hypothetical protein